MFTHLLNEMSEHTHTETEREIESSVSYRSRTLCKCHHTKSFLYAYSTEHTLHHTIHHTICTKYIRMHNVRIRFTYFCTGNIKYFDICILIHWNRKNEVIITVKNHIIIDDTHQYTIYINVCMHTLYGGRILSFTWYLLRLFAYAKS